jgi:mRNA interferase HigB
VPIVSRKELLAAGAEHSGLSKILDSWYRVVKIARWRSLEDLTQTYPATDGVRVGDRVYTVFNLAGNRFRLISKIYYEDQVLLVREILTHAEYDKENWKR